MNVVVFTQGLSPIVEPIFDKHGIQAVVESGPRGCLETMRQTRLAEFCRRHSIPYYWLTKPTRDGLVAFLKSLPSTPLDVAAVYSMSQLLPADVLDLFPRGVINAHPSKLPAYRGPNPYFWTFYDGCSETALTIHYLDSGEDTGDIILQVPICVKENDAEKRIETVNLRDKVQTLLGATMLKALDMVERNVAPRQVQPKVSPTVRARNITSENVAEVLAALRLPLDQASFFFQNVLGALPLRQFGIRRLSGDWCVKAVVQMDDDKGGLNDPAAWFVNRGVLPDRIYWRWRGFALARPDGWIVLAPRINLLKFLIKLVRDWMRLSR